MVTIRPRLSKVTDAQSACWKVEVLCICRPSGPGVELVSVWKPSTCRLLRSFGAMNGWAGGTGAATGFCAAAWPMKAGEESASGPSGIGSASAAGAKQATAAATATMPRRFSLRRFPTVLLRS